MPNRLIGRLTRLHICCDICHPRPRSKRRKRVSKKARKALEKRTWMRES